MREVSERVFWPNHVPDPTSDDYDTVPDSGNEFCTEVIGTEKVVMDYENCEENIEQIVGGIATERNDEDSDNRVVISRVTLASSPSVDLEDGITKTETQWQDIPSTKTYETKSTNRELMMSV